MLDCKMYLGLYYVTIILWLVVKVLNSDLWGDLVPLELSWPSPTLEPQEALNLWKNMIKDLLKMENVVL